MLCIITIANIRVHSHLQKPRKVSITGYGLKTQAHPGQCVGQCKSSILTERCWSVLTSSAVLALRWITMERDAFSKCSKYQFPGSLLMCVAFEPAQGAMLRTRTVSSIHPGALADPAAAVAAAADGQSGATNPEPEPQRSAPETLSVDELAIAWVHTDYTTHYKHTTS